MFSLANKVAVVTGSSRGIGRAIVERMAEAGAAVVVSSRTQEDCDAVAAAIGDKGGKAVAITCNISHKEDVEALVAKTVEHFGGLDILVCNAASNPVFGPMRDASDEAFDKIMSNNVRANLWLANLSAPIMAARGGGSIQVISSISGLRGNSGIGLYGISKAADMQLVRNLAVEWGEQGVRANCIAPGLIKTDFARALWENEALRARVERGTPLGRIGDPDDVAGAAVFLASDAAKFVTGVTLVIDGGLTISDAL